VSRYPYGRRPHTRDPRDYRAVRPVGAYTGAFVDLTDGFGPVEDQGQLGSCVSFGSCAALDYARRRQGLAAMPLSELFVYYAGRSLGGYPLDQDTGLEIRDGIQALVSYGAAPATDWPYDISRFADRPPAQAFTDAAADEATVYGSVQPAAVDDTIAAGHPVVIGFDVYASFESDEVASSGVMPVPAKGEQLLGGHCVVLCSTPQDGTEIGGVPGLMYRKARNSWSTDWGQHGYFWYPDAAMKYASDFWQVTTVSDPAPPIPPGPTPAPPAAPSQEELDLAAALHGDHDWVNRHHYGHTHLVSTKARAWLNWRGL
jgi:C1A family cysteine protease